jgi:hypothetical protein
MEQYIPKSVVLAGIERLSKIMDSLQEEPASEDLEKAAKDYSNNLDNIYGSIGKQTRNAFKAGAEWQKKHENPASEEFEKALAEEWKGYNERGAAMVDALEDNTQELAFSKGFYRGSKWQKNQGVTKEAVIGMATEEISINISKSTLDALDLCAGDKVIIQIRKKED